jgi:hypothetical protein
MATKKKTPAPKKKPTRTAAVPKKAAAKKKAAAPRKAAAKKKPAAPKKAAANKKAATPKKAAAKKTAAPKQAGAPMPSPDDKAAFAPGGLVKHDDNYSLVYAKFPHCEAFEELGIEGGGYTWHGLVEHVLRQDAPHALEKLDFDPEGSMFVALSKDLSALQAVGRALAKLEDPAFLTQVATTADLSEYD